MSDSRRGLPSLGRLLARPGIEAQVTRYGRVAVTSLLREILDEARALAAAGAPARSLGEIEASLGGRLEEARRPSLRPVLNATGVVIHTNLGRAPLSPEAASRAAEAAMHPTNLEIDLATGGRGQRGTHVEGRLAALLGAEAALVVNNCAAAVLLAVNSLAEGREVLVSRGELVEIGGTFRIPDVLRKGGARLREVGTTNRTRIADYRAALSSETGLILRVHPSNFRIVGFTEAPTLAELVALGQERGVPVVEDLGSGLIEPLPPPLEKEPSARVALETMVDAVAMSGDKLLGGPQAGLLSGRRPALEAMRRNPLYRALRVDKMTLAALEAVLTDHACGQASTRIPVHRMLALPANEIRARAEALRDRLLAARGDLEAELLEGESMVGGGTAPTVGLQTVLLALHSPIGAERLAAALRLGQPGVIARIADGRTLLDLRTIPPEEDESLALALLAALSAEC